MVTLTSQRQDAVPDPLELGTFSSLSQSMASHNGNIVRPVAAAVGARGGGCRGFRFVVVALVWSGGLTIGPWRPHHCRTRPSGRNRCQWPAQGVDASPIHWAASATSRSMSDRPDRRDIPGKFPERGSPPVHLFRARPRWL